MPDPHTDSTTPTPTRRWPAWLLLAITLPIAGWVINESQRVFRADWASAAVRHQLVDWVSGASAPKTAQEWDSAREALQRSIDITPDDPVMHDRMGDLYTVAGQRDWADEPRRLAAFAMAAKYYEASIALRPNASQTWAMLAASLQVTRADSARVHAAWSRALALGPLEGHVQPTLMQVALADWDRASPEMRAWATGLFDRGSDGARRDINAMAARYGLAFTPDETSRR